MGFNNITLTPINRGHLGHNERGSGSVNENESAQAMMYNDVDDAKVILHASTRGVDAFVSDVYIVRDLIFTAIVEIDDNGWTSRPLQAT